MTDGHINSQVTLATLTEIINRFGPKTANCPYCGSSMELVESTLYRSTAGRAWHCVFCRYVIGEAVYWLGFHKEEPA